MIEFAPSIVARGGPSGSATGGVFRPITSRKVFEDAVDQIAEAIQAGVVRIGDRLPAERVLAADMGISRPSIREAIKLLESAGVVESRRGGGTFVVADILPAELLRARSLRWVGHVGSLLEGRRMLEPQVAQLAGMYGTDVHFHAMRRTIDFQREVTEDRDAFLAGDVQFHRALARASGNPVLADACERIIGALQVARDMRYDRGDHKPQDSLAVHERTLSAVMSRDPGAIAAAMDEHLQMLERMWEEESGYRLRRLPEKAHPAAKEGQ